MEMIGTVLTIILALIILILFLLSPGIIARLIFRKTDEIKLRNWTALVPATVYFSIQLKHGNIKDLINSVSEGLEFKHWAISLSLGLLYFGITYIIQRLCVDLGIGVVDKLRK